jgi:hypothetical protein
VNIEDYIQRFQDGGSPLSADLPETPDARQARRSGLFAPKFQDGGSPGFANPLYITSDPEYSPAALSDMVRREVRFDPSQYPVEEPSNDMGQEDEDLSRLFETIDRMSAMRDAEDRKKIIPLQQRLDEATPYERDLYETTGLEPGLTRPSLLPYGPRFDAQGNAIRGSSGFKVPELLAGSIRGGMAPGATLRGVEIGEEEGQQLAMELAMETMGGSMVPGVPVNPGDFIAGMAVRPKGGVFRPPFSQLDYVEEGFSEYIPGQLAEQLIAGGMDETLAGKVGARAKKYYQKLYGTGNDPIRLKILDGTIEPRLLFPEDETIAAQRFAAHGRFPEALLAQARIDHQNNKGLENPILTPSLIQFERLYDFATGIKSAVPRKNPDGSMPSSAYFGDTLSDNALTYSAYRSDLAQQKARRLEEGDRISNELGVPFNSPLVNPVNPTDLTLQELGFDYLQEISDPTLRQAFENQEVIYDIDPSRVEKGSLAALVKPEAMASGIQKIPREILESISFPDMIERSNVAIGRAEDMDQAIQMAKSGNSAGIPKEILLDEGVELVKDLSWRLGNDSSWFEITDPAYTSLEGALMDHSVYQYATYDPRYNLGGRAAMESGKARIYSLRDKETGQPRVTVEIDNSNPDRPYVTEHVKGFKNARVKGKDLDAVIELLDEIGVHPDDIAPDAPELNDLRDFYQIHKNKEPYEDTLEQLLRSDAALERMDRLEQAEVVEPPIPIEEQVIQRRIERNRRIGQVAQESRQARAEREGLERAEQREVTAERAPRPAVGPNGEPGFINPVTGEFVPDVV